MSTTGLQVMFRVTARDWVLSLCSYSEPFGSIHTDIEATLPSLPIAGEEADVSETEASKPGPNWSQDIPNTT